MVSPALNRLRSTTPSSNISSSCSLFITWVFWGVFEFLVCFFGGFLGVLLGPAFDAFLSSNSSESLEEEEVVDEEADEELSAPPLFFLGLPPRIGTVRVPRGSTEMPWNLSMPS